MFKQWRINRIEIKIAELCARLDYLVMVKDIADTKSKIAGLQAKLKQLKGELCQ